MNSLAIVAMGSGFATWVIWLWLKEPHRPNERYGAERDLSAQAEVERTDIEQMIEARNKRRRRLGKPELSEDLVHQLRAEILLRGGVPPAPPEQQPGQRPTRPPAPPSP